MSKPSGRNVLIYTPPVRELPPVVARAFESRGNDLTVVVVRLGAMGDILRTVPPMRLLRRSLPLARIHWVLDERWRVLLEGHPDLNGLLTLPRKAWDAMARKPFQWGRLAGSLLDTRRRLRGLGARLALDFHGNLRSGIVCLLSGAPVRVGYEGHQQREGNRWFSTHRAPSAARRTPRVERNLDLIRFLGLPDTPLPRSELPLVARGAPQARGTLAAVGAAGSPYSIVSPGASAAQAYKKPPPELLAAACRELAGAGLVNLVVHGPGEEEDARRTVAASGGVARLAPPTDLPTLAALLDGATMFVGGDSGPLHLACAVGAPVLGIYGPTDPEVNRPWGVPFRVVHPPGRTYTGIKRIDRKAGGFAGLTPAQVAAAAAELLPGAPA